MKVGLDDEIKGLTKRTLNSEVLTKLRYIRENLRYKTVYAHYNLPWLSNETHQLSCVFHASNRDRNGVPFEKNPSARYYDHDQQIWCFACSTGGDVCWFVKKWEAHLHYGETIDFIGRTFGVALDAQDLAKRIDLHAKQLQTEESPRRKILSEMTQDKVNDEFYKLRKMGPVFHPIADRLEPEVFARKAEIDMFSGEYTEYAKQLRRWVNWTQEIIQSSLKHMAAQTSRHLV